MITHVACVLGFIKLMATVPSAARGDGALVNMKSWLWVQGKLADSREKHKKQA